MARVWAGRQIKMSLDYPGNLSKIVKPLPIYKACATGIITGPIFLCGPAQAQLSAFPRHMGPQCVSGLSCRLDAGILNPSTYKKFTGEGAPAAVHFCTPKICAQGQPGLPLGHWSTQYHLGPVKFLKYSARLNLK